MRAVCFLVGLFALALSRPIRADQPAPENQLRRDALEMMQTGRMADAREVHRLLWRTLRRPDDAFNIGMLSFGMHDWPTAAEFLTLWLDLVPAPGPAAAARDRARYDGARLDLQETRAHVGALLVQVSDPGAEVLVDGAHAGTSPLPYPVFVTPGEHRLEATLGDKRSRVVEVTAAAGGEQIVQLSLIAAPAIAAPMTSAPAPARAPGFQRTGAIVAGGAILVGTGLTVASVTLWGDGGDQARRIRRDGGPGACRSETYQDACSALQDTIMLSDALAAGAIVSFAAAGVFTAMALASPWLSAPRSDGIGVRVRTAKGGPGLAVEAVW